MTETAPHACPVCTGTERAPLIAIGGWTVRRCTDCGLGILDPRPDAAELARLYDQTYCDERFADGGTPGSSRFRKRLGLESHRIRFFRRLKRTGRVLDVGCGYGYFLAACREKGYDVHGLDFSEWAAAHARDRLGLPVTVAPIDAVQLPDAGFDVVTLWHSLEHTADPHRVLARATRWLRPDGVLVVDVPNHAGTDARRQGAQWNGWDLPFHFYHFTPPVLERFLAAFGYAPVRKKTYHSESIKAAVGRFPVLRPLARPIAKCFSGHSVAVAAMRLNRKGSS